MSEEPAHKLSYATAASQEEVSERRYGRRAHWCLVCALLISGLFATSYFWPRQPPRANTPGDFGDGWIVDVAALFFIPILMLVGGAQGFIATASARRQVRRQAYLGIAICLLPIVLFFGGVL